METNVMPFKWGQIYRIVCASTLANRTVDPASHAPCRKRLRRRVGALINRRRSGNQDRIQALLAGSDRGRITGPQLLSFALRHRRNDFAVTSHRAPSKIKHLCPNHTVVSKAGGAQPGGQSCNKILPTFLPMLHWTAKSPRVTRPSNRLF
jgi:hypothetical protein